MVALWINPKRRYQNKNKSNSERNKGKSYIVRAALHDCAPGSFAILERRAPSRLFSDNCEIAPNNKLSSAVGRYGPELRTDVKIIRERYHAPALSPRESFHYEIAERCRRLSMGAQGLRTTFRTSRRGGPPHQSPPCTRSIAAAFGFFVLSQYFTLPDR